MKKVFLLFVVFLGCFTGNAQISISGKVMDVDEMTLPGVNIQVKGTMIGTVTDVDGNFSINAASPQSSLIVSFVGYKTREIQVEGRSFIHVVMESDFAQLDEVIVVGYGSMKRSDLTGAVSSVRASEIQGQVLGSVAEALQGRLAGVHVIQHSGEPGGGISIKIRGTNSLRADNEPLYVIDGVPILAAGDASGDQYWQNANPLSYLNPNDIESIEVLKDASASAIYGARASNGVILISTKKADSGQSRVEFTSRFSMEDVGTPYRLIGSPTINQFFNDQYLLKNPMATPEQLALNLPYRGQDISRPYPENATVNVDWFDLILRQAYTQNYQLTVAGNRDGLSNLLSLNFDNQEGVIIGSKFQRGNLRYNGNAKLSDRFQLNSTINLNYSKNDRAQTAAHSGLHGVTFLAMMANPNTPDRDPNTGNPLIYDEFGDFLSNPYLEATQLDDITQNMVSLINFQGIYDITPALKLNFNLAGNYKSSDRDVFSPKTTAGGNRDNGRAINSSRSTTQFTSEVFLNYIREHGNHSLNAVSGVGYENFIVRSRHTQLTNFVFDDLRQNALQLGSDIMPIRTEKVLNTLQSAFVRVNYNFKQRYMFSFTGRADGSSKFGRDNKWSLFPSVALAWRASEEEFLKNLDALSNLKFRLSYGQTGNEAIQPYQTLATYGINFAPMWDGNLWTSTFPERIPSSNLRWETTTTFNVGVESGFFNNRLNITFDYYEKQTKDLLWLKQIPFHVGNSTVFNVSGGANSTYMNIGTIENKGFEVDVMAHVVAKRDFNYTTRLNFSRNIPTVVDLGGDAYYMPGNIAVNFFSHPAHRLEPGQQLGLFYGYMVDGLFQITDFTDYSNGVLTLANGNVLPFNNNNFAFPGYWKYKDINGRGPNGDLINEPDGKINEDDRTFIGNSNPKFIFGWNNSFNYKAFDLSLFFQGSYGNDIFNATRAYNESGHDSFTPTQHYYENAWTLHNQHNISRYPSGLAEMRPVDVFVEDGSYLRLKNIRLGYSFSIQRLNINKVSVYISGTNLFTLTNYSGADPEVSSYGNNIMMQGVDHHSYPLAKIYSLGLSVNL